MSIFIFVMGKTDGRKLYGNFVRLRRSELRGVNVVGKTAAPVISAEWSLKSEVEKSAYGNVSHTVKDVPKRKGICKKVLRTRNNLQCDSDEDDSISSADEADGIKLAESNIEESTSHGEEGCRQVRRHVKISESNVYKRFYCRNVNKSFGRLTSADLCKIEEKWKSMTDEEKKVWFVPIGWWICCDSHLL